MLFGQCLLDVPKKSVWRLLIDYVLNPFYITQMFSVGVWIWDYYRMYAYTILVLSITSIVTTLY